MLITYQSPREFYFPRLGVLNIFLVQAIFLCFNLSRPIKSKDQLSDGSTGSIQSLNKPSRKIAAGYRQNFRPAVSIIVTILLPPASPFLRDTATPRTDSFYYCGLFHALSVAVRTKARLSQGRREILETNDTATNAWARDDPTDTETFPLGYCF